MKKKIEEPDELNTNFLKGNNKVLATYLFPNGMVCTFGYNDQQIPMLQGEYSKKLHEKIKSYADENTIWDGFPAIK